MQSDVSASSQNSKTGNKAPIMSASQRFHRQKRFQLGPAGSYALANLVQRKVFHAAIIMAHTDSNCNLQLESKTHG